MVPESDTDVVVQVPGTPCTPQAQNATLPAKASISRASSPSAIMLAGRATSPATDARRKFSSPPPQSSITPPPSTQAPQRQVSLSRMERAETPTPLHPSSPPSTRYHSARRASTAIDVFARPTAQQIATASSHELREMLEVALVELSKLDGEVQQSRMSAAHHKLQHNLLSIETEEAAKRMEVEHEMTRREVEVLQMAEHSRQTRRDMASPIHTGGARYVTELKSHCQTLAVELAAQYKRLDNAKRLLLDKDDTITALKEENERLRQRIRENREHVTKLKTPGGLFAGVTPRPPAASFPTTPQQYRQTPKTPATARDRDRAGSQEAFAALLLADRVLSQESRTSAPTSPVTGSHAVHRGQSRHNRNVHSLSSLPTTAVRSTPAAQSALLPSIQFPAYAEPRAHTSQPPQRREKVRRRKSRDSTISASDLDERANERFGESDEEVQESQASQSATAMLRRNVSETSGIGKTPPSPGVAGPRAMFQSTLYGTVTKAGMMERQKRGLEEDVEGRTEHKKIRTEPVGLGLGDWSSRG